MSDKGHVESIFYRRTQKERQFQLFLKQISEHMSGWKFSQTKTINEQIKLQNSFSDCAGEASILMCLYASILSPQLWTDFTDDVSAEIVGKKAHFETLASCILLKSSQIWTYFART